MSNNYHTQIQNKYQDQNQDQYKSSILNEVAASNQILQQTDKMTGFAGTSVNRAYDNGSTPTYNWPQQQQPQPQPQPPPQNFYPQQQQAPRPVEESDQEIELSDHPADIPPATPPPIQKKKPVQQQFQQSQQSQQSQPQQPRPIIFKTAASPPNYTVEYIIIPLLILLIFVLITYPTTASYLERYIPPLSDFKSYLIRGAILAVAYIIIRFAASMIKKN